MPFLDRFVAGLLTGTLGTLALAWGIDGDVAAYLGGKPVEIFGILATLLVGYLALRGVQKQVKQQTDLANSQREADLRSALAVLPLALSRMYSIAESGFSIALDESIRTLDPSARKQVLAQIELPESVLKALQDCLKSANPDSASWLTLLVQKYQIFNSRTHDHVVGGHTLHEGNHISLAGNWALFGVLVEHCFRYARGEQAEIPAVMDPGNVCALLGSDVVISPLYQKAANWIGSYRSRLGRGSVADYTAYRG